jgi:hypothetical protein
MATLPLPPSISRLKLDDLVERLGNDRGWSATEARDAELWYRRFLALSYSRSRRPIYAISELSDDLWHEHILATKRYRADCQRIFKQYLDHTPVAGGRTRLGGTRLERAQVMYEKAFGSAPMDLSEACYTPFRPPKR